VIPRTRVSKSDRMAVSFLLSQAERRIVKAYPLGFSLFEFRFVQLNRANTPIGDRAQR
jgi:hypothetical protein